MFVRVINIQTPAQFLLLGFEIKGFVDFQLLIRICKKTIEKIRARIV